MIVLDITALGQSTLELVKQKLRAFVDDKLTESVEINDESVTAVSDRCQREIMSLQSDPDLRITIGRKTKNKVIRQKANRSPRISFAR